MGCKDLNELVGKGSFKHIVVVDGWLDKSDNDVDVQALANVHFIVTRMVLQEAEAGGPATRHTKGVVRARLCSFP